MNNSINWKNIGIHPASFLIPNSSIDLNKWAVVACDQYTQDQNYWNGLDNYIGNAPSTLRLILPEIYLNKRNEFKHSIWQNMLNYKNILKNTGQGFILVERLNNSIPRLGLVAVCDLECYGDASDKALIQSSEGIIIDRISPRLEIREQASMELSHALILFDDPENNILAELYNRKDEFEKLYDFDLNMNGGNIKAYYIDNKDDVFKIYNSFEGLKLNNPSRNYIFAVGDGNHSIKVAQTHWNIIKKSLQESELNSHPARYASVELCNIYDQALEFEPIHRIVYGIDGDELINKLNEFNINYIDSSTDDDITMCYEGKELQIPFDSSTGILPVAFLQNILDKLLEQNIDLKIDYIHGENEVKALSHNAKSVAFILPKINKSSFFSTIDKLGVLPRKTFSMGHANEKRYYIEARSIK